MDAEPKLFQHHEGSPFHISVGALVVNSEGKILAHHFRRSMTPPQCLFLLENFDDVYILMRESLENSESLEHAVHRGLQEEFGVQGEIRRYLGSIQGTSPNKKGDLFEKTTLYFEVFMTSQTDRPQDDEESFSQIEWVEPRALIEHMKSQTSPSNRGDMDESKIVETYLTYAKI